LSVFPSTSSLAEHSLLTRCIGLLFFFVGDYCHQSFLHAYI
jgi:hypothetical protein